MLGVLAQSWQAVKEAFYPMMIALMGYVTYWLRIHIGKSNGHGPLNKQTGDLIERISRLENELLESNKNERSDDNID